MGPSCHRRYRRWRNDGVLYVALGDVNGNGRPDGASATKDSPGDNWFAWWEQGKDSRQPWTKHTIADNQVGATNIQIARPVRAAEETAQGNGPISCRVCQLNWRLSSVDYSNVSKSRSPNAIMVMLLVHPRNTIDFDFSAAT